MVPARGARTVAPAGAGATERRRGGTASGKACRSTRPQSRRARRGGTPCRWPSRSAPSDQSSASNWASAWAQGKEWARQVSRQRARGGVQRSHLACMQARTGRNYTSSSLLATSADTVEGAVSAKSRTTLADSPCSLRRSARLAVRWSSALKRIHALAWSRLWDEAVRNRCAEVVDSSAALRSGSPQTSGRWSIPVGQAPDVVSQVLALASTRALGGRAREGRVDIPDEQILVYSRQFGPAPLNSRTWLAGLRRPTRCGTKSAPQTSRDG